MSNDLISRSSAVAIIEKQRLLVGKHNLSVEYNLASVQEEIEQLPIAYDVDKVVEKLEEESKKSVLVTLKAAFEVAEEIVKAEVKG